MLTHSFEDLTQTFRVLIESNFKLNQLLDVDRPEAVGTVETAINAKLNAFHNLYDLMAQHTFIANFTTCAQWRCLKFEWEELFSCFQVATFPKSSDLEILNQGIRYCLDDQAQI